MAHRFTGILDRHSVTYRFDGKQLQILDVWTDNGQAFESWRICPESLPELFRWLGY
ncbi:MAG: hypothetical protein WCO52_06200 [bacterium]